jgi:hypothetical protein
MAAALQCPSCGHRHPLDIVPDAPTFRCQACTRNLKVPEALRNRRSDLVLDHRSGAAPEPGAASAASAAASAASAPPVHASVGGAGRPVAAEMGPSLRLGEPSPADVAAHRSRPSSVERPGGPRASAPTVSPPGPIVIGAPSPGTALRTAAPRTAAPRTLDQPSDGGDTSRRGWSGGRADGDDGVDVASARLDVHWAVRILLWIVALAVGAVVVLIPARQLDVITFDGALNVIGGKGFKKWELPLVIVPPWAIVSAILAHLMIEGVGRLGAAGPMRPTAERPSR